MNEFPGVDPRPRWIRNHEAGQTNPHVISVDGVAYLYTIVQNGRLKNGLPYAVGFEHPTELYISENVPPSDRGPILAHEVREKIRFADIPEADRCTAALVVELSELEFRLPRRDYKAYVKRRAKYFEASSAYYRQPQHAAGVSSEFREGLDLATGFITHIARSLR